jgi:hypothetical protein
MERNMDLCRKILLEIEKQYTGTAIYNLQIDGSNKNTIAYHCGLLMDAGLIKNYKPLYADGHIQAFGVSGLTWEGHDFIDKIREDSFWDKIKSSIKENALPYTLAIIRIAVNAAVEAAVKQSFGFQSPIV